MRYFFALALWFLVPFPGRTQTSYVPASRTLLQKGYQLHLGGDVFQTSSVADPKGEATALTDDQSFTRYQFEFGGSYGLTDQLQLGLGSRFRHHQSTALNSSNERASTTGAGLQSIVSSFTYAFKPVGQLTYALEGLYRYTPYTNELSTQNGQGNLVLGDDGNEYSGGFGMTYSFKGNNFLTARAGYRNAGRDLSDEIYWQVEGALVWANIALVAGVDGVNSLKHDPLEVRPILNTGVSGLYNSSNREWVTPYAGLNVALGQRWRIELKAGQVVMGRSTDIGSFYGLQLVRRVEGKNASKQADAKFKTYDLEASVTKVSPKKEYVMIDKGLADDFQKGMTVDLFDFDYVGGNTLVARGTVISTKANSSVVKITQRFNQKKEIKAGLMARSSHR